MISIFSAVNRTTILTALSAACLLASTSSHASQMMTGVELMDQINVTLEKQSINGKPLVNPKQKFIACDEHLNIAPLFQSWKTVKLTCPSNDQWRLLVRVKMISDDKISSSGSSSQDVMPLPKPKPASHKPQPAQAHHHLKAVALSRSLTKGEMITASDVIMIPITKQQNTGIFIDPDDLIGRRVKTAIHTNKPVYSHQLEPSYMVEQKQPVTIAFSHQGIYVEVAGVSLENGQFGEIIKVENLSSGKTVFGKVIANRKISPIH